MVADIFETLEREGEADETLAFYISDNGYMAGEHGGLARKHLPYMEAIRVPLLMRWPGHVPAGLESTKLVGNVDLAPTIYEAAGVDPGYVVDGRSLFGDHRRTHILIERLVGGNWPRFAGIVTRKLHYIETLRSGSLEARSQELYDRRVDPYQLQNLAVGPAAASSEDELAVLHALVEAQRDCAGAACP
jgi:arylsulfatase A-like enzyme